MLFNQGSGSYDKVCDVLLEVGDDTSREVEKTIQPNRQVNIADISSVPKRHLSDVMSLDADSFSIVTRLILEKVAENGSERWHEIGIYFGVSRSVMTECYNLCTY